jgi:hypothetical protein
VPHLVFATHFLVSSIAREGSSKCGSWLRGGSIFSFWCSMPFWPLLLLPLRSVAGRGTWVGAFSLSDSFATEDESR